MLELTEEELNKIDLDIREKNYKILHYICFGIISMCHYFIISNGYLLYFIPLAFSLFSIGAEWYSNWRFYYYFEKRKDIPKFSEKWCLGLAGCAILTYLILLTNTFLINLF